MSTMPGLGILSEELLLSCGSRQGVGSVDHMSRFALVRTLRRHLVANRSRYEAWTQIYRQILVIFGYLENDVFRWFQPLWKFRSLWRSVHGWPLKLGIHSYDRNSSRWSIWKTVGASVCFALYNIAMETYKTKSWAQSTWVQGWSHRTYLPRYFIVKWLVVFSLGVTNGHTVLYYRLHVSVQQFFPCCRYTSTIKGLIQSRGLHVPAVAPYDKISNYTVTLGIETLLAKWFSPSHETACCTCVFSV